MPGHRQLTTPHPVAVRAAGEVDLRAGRALPEVAALSVGDDGAAPRVDKGTP
jgi:hypothetical protein